MSRMKQLSNGFVYSTLPIRGDLIPIFTTTNCLLELPTDSIFTNPGLPTEMSHSPTHMHLRAVHFWNKLPAEVVNVWFHDTSRRQLAVLAPRRIHKTYPLPKLIPFAHLTLLRHSLPHNRFFHYLNWSFIVVLTAH